MIDDLDRRDPGPDLASYPPMDRWDDWVEYDAKAWAHGERTAKHYSLIPTTCFNCEAYCGLVAYVDKETATSPAWRQPLPPGQPGAELRQRPGHRQPGL